VDMSSRCSSACIPMSTELCSATIRMWNGYDTLLKSVITAAWRDCTIVASIAHTSSFGIGSPVLRLNGHLRPEASWMQGVSTPTPALGQPDSLLDIHTSWASQRREGTEYRGLDRGKRCQLRAEMI
jgi:hypothetical protein